MEFLVIGGFIVALRRRDVPRGRPRVAGARAAPPNLGLGLAIAALPFVLVFWAGHHPGAGGLRHAPRGRQLVVRATVRARAAPPMRLGALALLGYVAIYVSDWMATNNIAGM